MSAQITEALKRAVVGGLVTAGLTFFTTLQTTDNLRDASIAAGAAFFGYIVIRGGFEGGIDSGRADRGDVIASDVR